MIITGDSPATVFSKLMGNPLHNSQNRSPTHKNNIFHGFSIICKSVSHKQKHHSLQESTDSIFSQRNRTDQCIFLLSHMSHFKTHSRTSLFLIFHRTSFFPKYLWLATSVYHFSAEMTFPLASSIETVFA